MENYFPVFLVSLEWSKKTPDGKVEIVDTYRGPAALISRGLASGKGIRSVVLQFIHQGKLQTTGAFDESVLGEQMGEARWVLEARGSRTDQEEEDDDK